jgi:hypothetical protein
MSCPHFWEWLDATWMRCNRCKAERATLDGTVTLHDPDDPAAGFWVTSMEEPEHLGRLLAPFMDRRVRITVETMDHA